MTNDITPTRTMSCYIVQVNKPSESEIIDNKLNFGSFMCDDTDNSTPKCPPPGMELVLGETLTLPKNGN